jgi:WD40 repeat protein
MESRGPRRRRGVVLTPRGLDRLQAARRRIEPDHSGAGASSLEALGERAALSSRTVARVLAGRSSVDRQSLEALFQACDLVLERADYHHPGAGPSGSLPALEDWHAPTLDWGEAPDTGLFHGRRRELDTLHGWLGEGPGGCRLIAVLGMGGVGKTTLVTRLLQEHVGAVARGDGAGSGEPFGVVVWRSLRNAPGLETLLESCLTLLPPDADGGGSPWERFSRLIREYRCLLVLDNYETVLDATAPGTHRAGLGGYGELLRLFAETPHRSLLLLTGREKPLELHGLDAPGGSARTLVLRGSEEAALRLLEGAQLEGTEEERRRLAERCGFSPLAVKLVAGSVREIFGGAIGAFLGQEATLIGGLRRVLARQWERLTPLENDLLLWLAIHRDWTEVEALAAALVPPAPRARVLEGIEALQRRSLLERGHGGFGLQPVVMDYAAEQLVERIGDALCGRAALRDLHAFPLLLASSPEFIRVSQRELLLEPVVLHLQARLGSRAAVVERLREVLRTLPHRAREDADPIEPSHAAGTLLNLLHHLGQDLAALDLSGLSVWHAHLPNVPMPRVDLRQADLSRSVISQPFGAVFTVAFHPDGERFATGEITRTVRLWRLSDGALLWSQAAGGQWIWTIAFSPDGSRLASAGGDRFVQLWQVTTGEPLRRLEGHTDQIHALAFHPSGQWLASASGDGSIRLWDLEEGRLLAELRGHAGAVTAVDFARGGARLISGGADGTLRHWDWSSGRLLRCVDAHDADVRAVHVQPGGDLLASGGADGLIHLWDLEGEAPLRTLRGHGSHVMAVQFSPEGRRLVSSSSDHTIRIWEVESGETLQSLRGRMSWSRQACFSPGGGLVLGGGSDAAVRLWEADSGRMIRRWQGYCNWIWCAEPSADGRRIVSGGGDGAVRIWDSASGALLQTLRGHDSWVLAACLDREGKRIASSGTDLIVVREAGSGRVLHTLQGHRGEVLGLQFSPTQPLLVSGGSDYTVRLWDPESGRPIACWRGHRDWVRSVAFSPDGRWIASGSHDHTARLWDVASGRCLRVLDAGGAWVWAVTFTPGGDGLITASGSDLVLWDLASGTARRRFEGHSSWIRSVSVSGDGRWLASAGTDALVHLWELSSGRLLRRLAGHGDQALSVRFHPDGERLFSGSADETLRAWDRRSGETLLILRPERLYEGMRIDGLRGLATGAIDDLRRLGALG